MIKEKWEIVCFVFPPGNPISKLKMFHLLMDEGRQQLFPSNTFTFLLAQREKEKLNEFVGLAAGMSFPWCSAQFASSIGGILLFHQLHWFHKENCLHFVSFTSLIIEFLCCSWFVEFVWFGLLSWAEPLGAVRPITHPITNKPKLNNQSQLQPPLFIPKKSTKSKISSISFSFSIWPGAKRSTKQNNPFFSFSKRRNGIVFAAVVAQRDQFALSFLNNFQLLIHSRPN